MKKRRIWHIYYGTRGTAGAYVHRLQKAAISSGFNSTAFVSAKFRFNTPKVWKIFFPITDRTEKRNFFIKALRYFELASGYFVLFWVAVIFRPVIDINLIDDLGLTYNFYRSLKLFKLKIFITCHDVLSHHKGLTRQRSAMFRGADRLIVHSLYAYNVLAGIVGEKNREKIARFPFPSTSLEEILSSKKKKVTKDKIKKLIGASSDYFLFIGNKRKSKGMKTLIKAWKICETKSGSQLVAAGKWSEQAAYLKKEFKELPNCILIDRYLDDEEFVCLIEDAKFVILPYEDYAHSAVLFACAWHRGAVLISDIEMFREILPGYELTFPPGDSEKLAGLIDKAVNCKDKEIRYYTDMLTAAVTRLDKELEGELKKVYAEFL